MKRSITPAYTFTPSAGTLNLSGISGFQLQRLYAVINLTANSSVIYAPIAGFGVTALNGTTLTLQASMSGFSESDALMILYDDGDRPVDSTLSDPARAIPTINGAPVSASNRLQVGLDPSQYPASALGQQTMATTPCVSIASDQSALPVLSQGGRATASLTRPATSPTYALGQVIGPSPAAALAFSVASAADAPFTLSRAKLFKSGASVAAASFRLHLYRTLPNVQADAQSWLTTHSDWLGDYDFTPSAVFSDGVAGLAAGPNVGPFVQGLPAPGTQTIYGVLTALAAYAPASGETFSVTLEVGR